MRLSDDARQCVVYLGIRDVGTDDQITPVGTGFLVVTEDPQGSYIVTARHVAHLLKDGPFDIRFNDKKGRGRLEHIDQAEWVYHLEDDELDVAVLSYRAPDWAEVVYFGTQYFATKEKITSKDIGPGDEAYVVGVFAPLHGNTRNLPVVHLGSLALFPDDEAIPIRDWRDDNKTIDVNGYLVEAHTLPGLSGAPVFIRRSIKAWLARDEGPLKARIHGSVWLLGLWQGAWMGRPGKELKTPRGEIIVPLGMGVVMPADKIMEVLNREDLKTARLDAKAARDLARAASLQSAPPTKADNPDHREDFNSLLSAATSKNKLGLGK